MRLRHLVALGGLAPAALLAAEPSPGCVDLLPGPAADARTAPPGPGSASPRVEPEDLVRLRDIGPNGPAAEGEGLIRLSPDGRNIAFQLRRADPERNSYCLAMLVLETRPGAEPLVVDSGGELIRRTYDLRGLANFPTGMPLPVVPHWSPDGRWIAFLKRIDGRTQLWRAAADGSGSAPIVAGPDDIEEFGFTTDGSAIVFASRPALRAAYAALAHEGLSGFHYDARYSPMSRDMPFPPAPIPAVTQVLDFRSGQVRPASPDEASLLAAPAMPSASSQTLSLPSPRRIWVEGADPLAPEAATLHADGPNGERLSCDSASCAGAFRPRWTVDGRHVRFFRREGWARGSTAIHEWDPDRGSVRRLYLTDDLLIDCQGDGDVLICLREGSLQPRRIERLDPGTGRREVLFDPNPSFGALSPSPARRLRWRNEMGLETIGDLVLPREYRAGRRYPLIVVQYDTRGFLRGGTGDEYPIQAFAGRGYAVLVVNRTRHVGLTRGLRDVTEIERANLDGFADRRSTSSAVETGVRLLIAEGLVDPERIGITGFSDGASTATFALINGTMFRAAAMSNCCIDTTLPTRVGPGAAREFHAVGYPRMIDRAEDFWAPISLSRNARRIRVPILLQLADSEYMSALESFTALREADVPADMFVFPQEYHLKWQPAHRLAVYRRALDWFDYWLRDIRSDAPDRQADLRRWDELRTVAPAD